MRTLTALFFMLLACSALAAPPAQDIVVARVAGYTGPVVKEATEMSAGAQVYFDAINANGGVLGRKIKLLAIDDHFKTEETVQQIEALKGKISALLLPVGSAQFSEVQKAGVLDRIDFPVLGVIPAVESFRAPMHKNLFHFRAGDFDQIDKIIDLTTSVGMTKLGVLATNNPNGDQVISFMQEALGKRGLKLASVGRYTIAKAIDFGPAIKEYQKSQPDMVLLLGPPFATAQFVKDAKSAGVSSTLYGMSYTDFDMTIKTAGINLARGVAIAQVFPNLNNKTIPIVREFRDNFDKFGKLNGATPTYFNIEGYIGGKIIVEAIKRSKDASPAGVRRGLEMLHDYDTGGFIVDFSPTKHNGSKFVDLSIIGAKGDLVY
jgi:ABC-type branched-subunit amino acid transport system substrate-binding protein